MHLICGQKRGGALFHFPNAMHGPLFTRADGFVVVTALTVETNLTASMEIGSRKWPANAHQGALHSAVFLYSALACSRYSAN